MRFLGIYRKPERNTPPTQEEMAEMGKLIQEGFKAGWLIGTGVAPVRLATSASVWGPRELAIVTWCPSWVSRKASVAPMFPAPMIPMRMMFS